MHAIGQMIIAVLGDGESFSRAEKIAGGSDDVGADVELVDFAHGGRGFGLFDDVHDAPRGIANDAAIGQGLVHHGGQQRQVRLAAGRAG